METLTARSPVGPYLAHHPVWVRYTVAVLVILLVASLRFAAVPLMGGQAPLLPFSFAVFAAAYLGGYGPALAATATASIAATLLFANFSNVPDVLAWTGHVLLFTTLGGLVSLMMHRLQLSYGLQRAALAAAEAGKEQLRTITDAMPALIAYVDSEHRYRFNNKGYEEWFQLERDALLGMHARDVLGDEVYQSVWPHMDKAIAGTEVDFEAVFPYRNAGTRHVSAHYVPDRGADGKVRGFFVLVQDISMRKREEQLLADARLRLSIAMRVGRSGMFEWDMEKNVVVWSDELLALHGFKDGEFEGTTEAWMACIHPDDLQRIVETGERARQEGEVDVEYRIRRRDTGETRWLHARGKVSRDDAGKPVRMLGINVDITDRKRAEEALREADRHKDEFLAMLAHELRNPLTPIRNVAHILTDQRADIDTLRRCGLLVQRQVANVARLVDDLLDVARVRRGLIEIKNAPLDLHTVIDSAIETLQSSFDEKQQIVSFTRLPIRALVNGDSVRLEQVFTNLLANASKFSPPYSRIDLQAAVGDEGFLVRIRDHGDGIDAQLLPRIFDLFVQGDQSLDRPQAGLGIGLTLVKWVVELHKGSVRVASQGLGHGAEFIVALPIATDAEPAVPEPVAAATATVRRRVLIVEDNSDSAESLRILLRLAGHEVVATNQAFGALEALESFAPEFIFADVGLPGLDGFSLAGMIRHHPRGKDARVYAVTGYGRPQDREQALAAGFDGQLTKPVDPKVLLALLNEELVHRGATPIEQQ